MILLSLDGSLELLVLVCVCDEGGRGGGGRGSDGK
jgi:hypothetical protein